MAKKQNRSVTLDFNKNGVEEMYDAVIKESKFHGGKKASAVFELIGEALRHRRLSREVTIIDAEKNVLAKIKN